jgi:hypothetical protein
MGERWEVSTWLGTGRGAYVYETVYFGPSLVRALAAAFKAKRASNGNGCVKVEWR